MKSFDFDFGNRTVSVKQGQIWCEPSSRYSDSDRYWYFDKVWFEDKGIFVSLTRVRRDGRTILHGISGNTRFRFGDHCSDWPLIRDTLLCPKCEEPISPTQNDYLCEECRYGI